MSQQVVRFDNPQIISRAKGQRRDFEETAIIGAKDIGVSINRGTKNRPVIPICKRNLHRRAEVYQLSYVYEQLKVCANL